MKRVLFIHMPLAVPNIPSLAAHLLAGILEQNGLQADVFYGTTRLKRTPPIDSYIHGLAGEVIFTPHLYREFSSETIARKMVECPSGIKELRVGHRRCAQDVELKLSRPVSWPIPRREITGEWPFGTGDDEMLADVLTHMELAGMCIDQCFADIPTDRYDIFAFSVAFDAQKVASLTLAQRLKAREPSTKIVFGGTACDGEMGDELIRRFPFIDVVSQGDADLTIAPLARWLRGQTGPTSVPGIIYRDNGQIRQVPQMPPLQNLDSLPSPDYSQFLAQLKASNWSDEQPFILFEASRGCWWGEKHHCKFCGLRADGLAYRRKSPRRTMEELEELADKYPAHVALYATDAIVDYRYMKSFFPEITELAQRHKWKLFFEIKSNLKKEDVAMLAEARVKTVQPGIESFSDHVLNLMDKGATGIKQVQLLKWLASYRIRIIYNFIIGTPGETAEDYEETLELIPLITHLPPPTGVNMLSLDRFSPYFSQPETYGMTSIEPKRSYRVIYPHSSIDLSRLVYKFDYRSHEKEDPKLHSVWTRLARAVDRWKEEYNQRAFWMVRCHDGIDLVKYDRGSLETHKITGTGARLYQYCDTLRSFKEICREFPGILEQVVRACLEECVSRGWMYRSRAGQYIALAAEAEPEGNNGLVMIGVPEKERAII